MKRSFSLAGFFFFKVNFETQFLTVIWSSLFLITLCPNTGLEYKPYCAICMSVSHKITFIVQGFLPNTCSHREHKENLNTLHELHNTGQDPIVCICLNQNDYFCLCGYQFSFTGLPDGRFSVRLAMLNFHSFSLRKFHTKKSCFHLTIPQKQTKLLFYCFVGK